MNTCEICGHDHGSNVVHIKRTADWVTERYLAAVNRADRSRIDQAFVDAYEVNAAYIINRALMKLGSEC